LQYTFGPPLGGDWRQVASDDPTPVKPEQELEAAAPDTDVKDVTTKKLSFKAQGIKPRPKIAK